MTDALIPIAIVAIAALLVWKRWTRATHTQRVDITDLGGGLAGIIGSAAMLVLAWATTPAGRVPWAFVAAAVAMALGAMAALLSLQLTEYLPREDGLYYRPDLRIGLPVFIALIVVLAIKALHVLRALQAAGQAQGHDVVAAALTAVDPISPAILAFTASYIGFYQLWLFRRGWRSAVAIRRPAPHDARAGAKDQAKSAVRSLIHGSRQD